MNKIYKVVWNKARGCYVVGSELMKTHQGKKSHTGGSNVLSRVGTALLMGIASWGAACNFIYADVTVADSKYNGTINKTGITGGGTQYDITNQQVNGKNALNKFDQFDIAQKDVANMHLGEVDHQINIVNQKMNVDGVVNALKNNKIGGDVYFFSDKGIAVGSTGVFNVGRLTLGTNAQAGQVLFDKSYIMNTNNGPITVNVADKVDQFYQASAKERGQTLNDFWNGNSADKNATITVAGRIYASDSVVLANSEGGTNSGHGTGISIASGAQIQTGTVFQDFQAGQTADHYRSRLINTSSVKNATSAIATADGIALVADKDISVSGDLISNGRNIDVVTKDNISVKGNGGAQPVRIVSDGGKIALTASSSDAKLQADPKDIPVDGMISIKDAYIDSTSDTKDSGNVEITAVRNVMGVSRVTVDDTTIDASGKNGKNAGNVAIHATADTQLYAWDIGDGAYAQVQMGKNSQTGNTIQGDNIDIAAKASTTGTIGDDGKLTDAEIEAAVERAEDRDPVLGLIKDYGGNLRTVGSVTSISAGADVDIEKTDMTAVGGQKSGTDSHGNVTITSEARSAIMPPNFNFIGFGFNAGIGRVDSHVNVDHSQITAAKDISMKADGSNTVNLSLTELNLLEEKTKGFSLDVSWAELHSDVSAKVGQDAVLTSRENTEIAATSTRSLASNVSSYGSTLAMAGAVGIADTKATAEMAGTVYAGGDVSVKAKNTLANSGTFYTPDTVSAASTAGDTALKPTVDTIKGGAGWLFGKIKDFFVEADKTGAVAKDLSSKDSTAQSKPWNKLGANAATALLFSENDATASVTGKVRGVDNDGNGSDSVGAKSLSVATEVLSRSKATVGTSQNATTTDTGTTKNDATISASVAYMQQNNHAESFISGDTKTTGDTAVTAETKMPWQTSWQDTSVTGVLTNLMTELIGNNPVEALDLVDGWSQASGNGDKASGAASITVVNYDNSAKAYIGKKDAEQTEAPKVEAGGKVTVEGTTDITTANFAGSIQSILQAAPINIWKTRNLLNKDGWNMEGASKAGVGGSALAVHQKNKTEAYIDDGAIVKADKDVDVNAQTKATNIAISTSGGMAKTVALDASVSVNMFDNETKARIGNATVSGKNVGVAATDDSKDINLAGGVGVSGGTGIGASVAYNHIIRDTEAAIHGKVDAKDAVEVQAKNTGEIIAASVAGAVAYDSKTTRLAAVNGAGSSGFHGVESGDSGTASLEDLVDSMAGEKSNLSESADSSIAKVAEKDNSMKENTAKAQGGLAAAANVSVNRIKDNAKAYVGKKDAQQTERPSVTADVLRVTGVNDSAITTTSAAISANLHAKAGASVAGSFMYNSIEGNTSAYVEGADLKLSGNEKQDANGQEIDEALTVQAENQEHITNIAASGSGATKGASVAGQISLNWVDNTTDAHVKDSTIRADEAMNVAAKDQAAIDSYTGAVSVSTGSSAVGAAIAVNLIEGKNTSYVENTDVSGTAADKKGDLSVTAEEASKITSIVASGSAANNMAASFSASGNWIHTTTDAYISNAKDMKTGALSVKAGNHSTATLGVGNASLGNNAAGASVAVMVNDSAVAAHVTGDEQKQHTIAADSITVEADNAYNGSASDSDSDSSAKTVAVGFAGGLSQFAGSGSVTVNVISQNTDATLGKGKYEVDDDISVNAKSAAKLFGMAGGMALSGGSGIGAAVDVQTYTGHTYAGIKDGAKVEKAGNVKVQALSEEQMTSVAATGGGGATFGGAGAAGAHSISTDTKAYVGNEKDTPVSDAEKAEIQASGDVEVTAKDTSKLSTVAGAAGAAGTAGVGLTAAVEVVDQNVTAYVGNHADVNGKNMTVRAETVSDSMTLANGLGAGGTAGVAGSASETFVNQTTKAYVGKSAKVTTAEKAAIQALSTFKQGAEAGSVGAAGTVGVGVTNSTVSLKADTQAYADTGATISGGKKVELTADHTSDLTYATVAGGVGGTVGASGNVGVNVLDTTTKAYAGENTEISAEEANAEGISITASDTTKLNGGNGGASIGVAGGGAGAAIGVTNIKKDTEAYAGKNAKLDTQGKLEVAAKNLENMTNVSVQAAGGLYAGLAGAVNVVNLTAVTKAFTDTGVAINQKQKQGGDISVTASHEIEKMENGAGGAAVSGGGSVGAAVDVVNIKTQTNAYLGDGNTVHSNGNVSIQAEDNMHDIGSRAYAASVGAFGLSGSLSIYNIGSTMSEEDKQNLSGKTSADGAETDFDSWVNSQLNQSDTGKAMSVYDSGALAEVKDKLGTQFATEAPSSTGEKGTLAKVGQGTTIEAGGNVTVKADDTLQMTTTMGNLSGGVSSAGMSVSTIRTDTQTKALVDKAAQIAAKGNLAVSAQADHALNSVITGASISGGVSGQGTVQVWNDHSDVLALMGDTGKVTAKNISVSSANNRDIDAQLYGASVALSGALNGAVIDAEVSGKSEAGIGEESGNSDSSTVKAEENLTISSTSDTKLKAKAVGAAAGAFAGTGTGVNLSSDVDTRSFVGKGEKLSGKRISITSENTPQLDALATSAGVGIAGIGATVANVKAQDDAKVSIGDGASLTAEEDLTIRAKTAKPKNGTDYNAFAHAIAGGGGVISGAVAVIDVTLDQDTETTVGDNVTITAKKATIAAEHSDAANLEMESVAAGSYSGTGGETNFKVNSDAKVSVGNGTSITTDDETVIGADNDSTKDWLDRKSHHNAYSGGAALASGNGVVSKTDITHTTTADVGRVTIKANVAELTDEEKVQSKTIYDKNAIAIDAHSRIVSKDDQVLTTGSVVGAAHVKNTHTAQATTEIKVADGATLLAGDTEKAKATYTDNATVAGTVNHGYRGGSIAVGSRNDADLSGNTLVDVFGAAGYAGSENNVTYKGEAKTTFGATAETAKGDIFAMAGRDSQGETGTIHVEAHSDILNATAIPISYKKDPVAKIDSQAQLAVTTAADMKSDRDIGLKAKAGNLLAIGSGEVKDWVNEVAEAFGSEGGQIGKKEISSSATVAMDGKAETGIHRNQQVTIGGTDTNANGTWNTTIEGSEGISYTFSGEKVVGSTLYERLHELQQKLSDYSGDPAAKAAYEAEIAFLEEKMAAQGLGYFETDNEGHRQFIELVADGKSELETAKEVLKNAEKNLDKAQNVYQERVNEAQDKMDRLGDIIQKKNDYDAAVSHVTSTAEDAAQKKTEMETAKTKLDTTEAIVKALAAEAGMSSIQDYVNAHTPDAEVQAYVTAKSEYEVKQSAYDSAYQEAQAASGKVDEAKTYYRNAATGYNTTYQDSIPTEVTEVTADVVSDLNNKKDAASIELGNWNTQKGQVDSNYTNLKNQIAATEDFFNKGGKESGGKFSLSGQELEKVTYNGVEYYLLHKEVYQQMTHDVELGTITSQLGDILLEGDTVSGSGTMTAGGDATVSVINNSPNNLVVGDIKVIGRGDTAGAGQGGTIFFNDVEMKGNTAEEVKAAIKKANKDANASVSMDIQTRYQTDGPTITVDNQFRPQAYVDEEKVPLYGASETQLKGYIYNPRGRLKVTSANGDVYNNGSIYAGTVDMVVSNGDFIQSFPTGTTGPRSSISSIGGNPLDDSGQQTTTLGTGILANGNIFISARYVNINSKIQSGVANWNIEIPLNYKLYYMDGSNRIDISDISQVPQGKTILVADGNGETIDNLSYDRTNDRFVLSDVEVHGGKVSIVGTIINTTNDTSKARIEALDGYGSIQVKNNTNKDLELKTISTGSGVEGQIEITDLDRRSGQITRKTTYTRDNGQIKMTVQSYTDGQPSGTAQDTTFDKDKDGSYETAKGAYYTLQTGKDRSYSTTYELHETEWDWWGIQDKNPTGQDMLDQGGTITDVVNSGEYTLDGGAFVSDSNDINGSTTDEVYKTSEKTINNKTESTFTKKSKRLWYTLGLAKKFDYKLVEKKYDTTITQHSLKADYDIGIGFNGNENGGTLTVNGGRGNLLINGTLFNGRGTTDLTSGSITQGTLGYVDTGTLNMTATEGSAGTKGAGILTSADKVSGSAAKDWSVKVADHGVTVGNVTAGNTLSIEAGNGISQEANTKLIGSRIEMTAGTGAIQGANGKALEIQTKQGVGKDYGLKASAEGDISINHTGGDLYLDSVISSGGDVSLTTEGSFIDNNLDDVIDESAKEKLLAWANAAVLEGSTATVEKQKNLLIAKVQEKYNEYQSLSAYVKDGKYTLGDSTKEALRQNGVTDMDAYILEKQSRYEALKDSVGSWTKEGVETYVKSIQDSTDGIYGNASLTKAQLTGDTYLTADEKANILVGSAKSAKDLLLTFTPGGIKEGITDTNPIIKGTPHVSGKNVTLTATGGLTDNTGNALDGNIGKKETGKTIDLSAGHIENLTAEELLALSAAERGDFQLSGDTVTVSTVRSIDAEVSGKLTAKAENGSIYLVSEGAIKNGSELTAGKELRLKAAGDLDGVTVSAKDQTVLEAGSGKISDVKVKGNGVLTARAKDGVTLSKDDGDMHIHTIYASEGDVHLNLNGHSLVAKKGDGEEDTLHMEGENITIENAKDIKGKDDTSVGMKVTGKTDADGNTTAGSITASADTLRAALFGELAKETQTALTATQMELTNHGIISGGTYHADGKLQVTNQGLIDGGTFSGADVQMKNQDRLGPADIQGTKVTLDNQGTIYDGKVTATDTLTVMNQGTGTIEKGTFTGGTTTITNAGKVNGGDYVAKTGDLTYSDTSDGSISGGTLTADTGNVSITAKGELTVDTIEAKQEAKVTSESDGKLTTVKAGSVDLDVKGKLDSDSLTADEGNVSITAKGELTVDTIEAKQEAKVTSESDGKLGTVEAGSIDLDVKGNLQSKKLTSTEEDVTLKVGGTLSADVIQSNQNADLTSHDSMVIGTLKTTGDAKATSEVGDVDITLSDIGKILSLRAGQDVKLSQSDSVALDVTAGRDILATAPNAKISSGTISMEAEDHIRFTDKDSVNKLEGVDTTQTAGSISGSGNAGSLISGEGQGHDFDVTQKGSVLLESKTGDISLKAKQVEGDTVKVGTAGTTKTPATLQVSADYVGIDDLQSDADRLHVMIRGSDGESQSRYSGLHITADGDVLLKDSRVEHLNFTGKDHIGLADTAIGGDSVLSTEKVKVTIKKNPGNTKAEWFGDLFLDGLNIRSDRQFTDIRNGLTLNGERFPETASYVMKRSLYGRDYLGKDGQEKEKEETQEKVTEMSFGPMTEKETYETVGK